ncbi:MAG: hypothetical protein PHG43_01935 [Phenylobacterium sp.]|nr:hypothetical protein [Phenylobacterium sp.]
MSRIKMRGRPNRRRFPVLLVPALVYPRILRRIGIAVSRELAFLLREQHFDSAPACRIDVLRKQRSEAANVLCQREPAHRKPRSNAPTDSLRSP